MANKSDDLRDQLADVLLELTKITTDDEGNPLPPDPRVLAVARAFIKDNPPEELPTPDSVAGVLEDHMKNLPFDGGKAVN